MTRLAYGQIAEKFMTDLSLLGGQKYIGFGRARREADQYQMLDPNILRENVDGETIEWAETRLSV